MAVAATCVVIYFTGMDFAKCFSFVAFFFITKKQRGYGGIGRCFCVQRLLESCGQTFVKTFKFFVPGVIFITLKGHLAAALYPAGDLVTEQHIFLWEVAALFCGEFVLGGDAVL